MAGKQMLSTVDQSEGSENLNKDLEDYEIQQVLKNGTDLREYALQIDKNIKEAEKASVADYLKESSNIGSLHNQIEECDGILERMENMLLTFQKRSVNMSVQLSNRQSLKGPLSSFIEDIAVSETLILQRIYDSACYTKSKTNFCQRTRVQRD
ncbi:unnamed protein product [Leptidea sinapis]|uniref:Vacuolar protein sorting-associated protein 52 homolog n=1 Tax=Leptidea sinapis TaxID=189913 RepID=A0A5E4QX18_9NEOP|nr:unnamed protein product [Leptidea sinapis]